MNEKTEKIKKIRNLLLAGGCVITAIICRHLPTNRESGWVAFFQLTRAYLYITLYCVWGISLQRRIVNKTARRRIELKTALLKEVEELGADLGRSH